MTAEPERECALQNCGRSDVLVSLDDGGTWWCPDHVLDEDLPPLAHGSVGECRACGNGCATWLGEVCLHRRCERSYLVGRPHSPPLGAYARLAR